MRTAVLNSDHRIQPHKIWHKDKAQVVILKQAVSGHSSGISGGGGLTQSKQRYWSESSNRQRAGPRIRSELWPKGSASSTQRFTNGAMIAVKKRRIRWKERGVTMRSDGWMGKILYQLYFKEMTNEIANSQETF